VGTLLGRITGKCLTDGRSIGGVADQQEQRYVAILESKQATPDEKFQALVDLARLAGIVLHAAVEDEAEIALSLQQP
jgi:hypothetical protein